MRLLAALLCLVAMPALAQSKLTLGYQPTIDTAPAFVAQEQGMFRNHGLAVTLTPGVGQVQIAGVAAGSLQIGQPTIPQLMQAVESGLDLVIVAGDNFTSADSAEFGLVERKGLALNTPGDYVGKRVGVQTIGAFLQVLFVDWLRRGGVDPARVTFVEVPFPTMGDVLRQGTVDAVLPVEPFITRMVQSGAGTLVADYTRDVPNGLPVAVYVAQRGWTDAHRAEVEGFRAALTEGGRFLVSDRDAANADMGKYLKLPPAVLAAQKLPVMHVDVSAQGLAEWGRILVGQKLLQKAPDVDRLIWK